MTDDNSNLTSSREPICMDGYMRHTVNTTHKFYPKRNGWWLMVLLAWDALWRKGGR